jgi:predicted ribosome quality control (RQC) complex YloA/Tae2 family protein
MKTLLIDDCTVIIGQSAIENTKLILSSQPEDIWFHLASFPSPHVVLHHSNPPKNLINASALLCKSHSKYKNLKNLKISYTTISNLNTTENFGAIEFKRRRIVKEVKV